MGIKIKLRLKTIFKNTEGLEIKTKEDIYDVILNMKL